MVYWKREAAAVRAFFALPEVIHTLYGNAELKRAWIEGPMWALITHYFGPGWWFDDNFKRLVLGKVAREAHESLGLHLDQRNVQTRAAPGVSNATRYGADDVFALHAAWLKASGFRLLHAAS